MLQVKRVDRDIRSIGNPKRSRHSRPLFLSLENSYNYGTKCLNVTVSPVKWQNISVTDTHKQFCQSNRTWRRTSGQLCIWNGSIRHLLTSVSIKKQRKMKTKRDWRKGNERKRPNRKSLKRNRPKQCDSILPPLHHLLEGRQKRPHLKGKSNSY